MTIVSLPYGKTKIDIDVPDENFMMVAWPRGLPGSIYVDFEMRRALNSEGIELVIDENTLIVLDGRLPRRYYKPIINYMASHFYERASTKKFAITVAWPGGSQEFGNLGELTGNSDVYVIDPRKGKFREQTRIGEIPILLPDFVGEYDQIILVSTYTYDELFGFLGGIEYLWMALLSGSLINDVAGILINNPWDWGVRNGFSREVSRVLLEFLPPVLSVHLILNYEGEIVKVYAGEPLQAAAKAEKFLDRLYLNRLYREPDALVLSAGGHPADLTLYSALLALVNSKDVLSHLDRVYFFAECVEGFGNRLLERLMRREIAPDYVRRLNFNRWDDVRAVFRYLLLIDIRDKISMYSRLLIPNTKNISEIMKDLNESYRSGDKIVFVPYGDETVLTI